MREWVFGWMSRGWKQKEGPISNLELWVEAVDVVRAGGHQVTGSGFADTKDIRRTSTPTTWRRGRRREQTQSSGIVPSKFDEWLAVEREKGRVTVEPQAFPTDDAFRASRPYPVVSRPNLVT